METEYIYKAFEESFGEHRISSFVLATVVEHLNNGWIIHEHDTISTEKYIHKSYILKKRNEKIIRH